MGRNRKPEPLAGLATRALRELAKGNDAIVGTYQCPTSTLAGLVRRGLVATRDGVPFVTAAGAEYLAKLAGFSRYAPESRP